LGAKIKVMKSGQNAMSADHPSVGNGDTSCASALPKFRNVAHADTYAFNHHILHLCPGCAILLRPANAPKHGYDYPNLHWKALLTNGLDNQNS